MGQATHVCSIGSFFASRWPAPEEIRQYFFEDLDWEADGSFFLYGAQGTENEDPYSKRIDISLAVFLIPDVGMVLHWSKAGGGHSEHFYSRGDVLLYGQFASDGLGELISGAFVISPDQAWLAVTDFILRDGCRSDRIAWLDEADLPDEAIPPDVGETLPVIE